jgi:hypothetical protein
MGDLILISDVYFIYKLRPYSEKITGGVRFREGSGDYSPQKVKRQRIRK